MPARSVETTQRQLAVAQSLQGEEEVYLSQASEAVRHDLVN